ncbi:hypothetical protein JOB18_045982 [Solea senegalensis]|nr:C-C motif chemokine 25 [Solea senegalensis]KAG7466756.1 C-C motif chemokine 20-like [Solea senegalensis]KAG7466757.1 hypothetical protein JOB18_045982 [Solea senegalensis]KAG7466758.1 hypothetical protein JOB18_045982 [Solea senegalensis]
MRFNTLFFLLGLSWLCLALAHVSYEDCCLMYVKRMSHSIQKHAVKYRVQETDGGCNIRAVIFTMRRGRVFCTDPRESWVIELRKKLDKQRIKDERNKGPNRINRARVNRG